MSKQTILAPMKLTKGQGEWIEREVIRTGEAKTTIVRTLIQAKIDSESEKAK